MKSSFFLLSVLFLGGCVTFAPPAPMLTYGGPKTTEAGKSEAVLAFGTGVALFEGAHTGAQGWFGRYKYGIGEKTDLGLDILGAKRNEGLYLSIKAATRYQLKDRIRIEIGAGVADDSDGKSINGDAALTIGTIKDKDWNYYSSVRLGYAKGYRGDAIFADQTPLAEDMIAPPDATIGLLNLGAEGRISENQSFVFEGGYGYVFPEGEDRGPVFYVSAGLRFLIGR